MSLNLIISFINNKYDKALVLKDSCKAFDEKKKRIYSVTYFFKFLHILNIVYPILSNYSISIETIELNESVYPILYTRYIGKPIEIYFNNCLASENYDYEFRNYSLYFHSNYSYYNIVFIWNDSFIDVENNGIDSTILTDENIIETNNQIFNEKTTIDISDSNVLEVDTQNDVIQPKKININAKKLFQNCNIIKTINFENFDTTRIFHTERMFDSCTSLTSIYYFYPENAQDMSYLFNNCISLIFIDFNNPVKWFNNKVTNMEYMFANCSSLTLVELLNFNTSNVFNFDSMFLNCSNLTSLNLNHFDTSQAINMDIMFGNCKSLTSLNLNSFNTYKITNMSFLFVNCSKLSVLNIDNFITTNVISMNSIFYNCYSLISLNF